MTLTTATVLPPAASPARQAVRAVVLTSGARPGLRALLDALAASASRPDSVVVLDTSADDGAAEVVAAATSRTFAVEHVSLDSRMPDRAAVTRWLTDGDVADDDLVWLLPVGCVPEPGTLGRLLAAHRRSPSVGIVGPKHVDATRPGTLRSVGITTTRSGRVVEDPPLGEPDQGQYDLRRDVIAVPLAGMLASAGALRSLRGWERSFGDLGADLDLGWRAQLAGHRVVVAPDARMRSVAALGLATATTGARRRAARRVALARAPWWQVPFLALWVLLSSVAAGVGLLLLKRPRAARAAFSDVVALDPLRTAAARHRTRGGRALRHRDIGSLFVPASAIVRRSLDRAHEAVIAPSSLPDETVRDPEGSSGIGRLLVHPALLAVVAAAGVVVAAGRDIGGGLVSRFGSGVTGGELLTTRATSRTLWHAAFDGWHGPGLGGDGPADPSLALLAVPTWVLEQLPGAGDLTSSAGAVVGALLVLALPLAAVSAYVSSRVITSSRSRPVRGAVALLWATGGAAGAAVAQGRLGALVALVLLPPVLAGVVMLARPTGTATGAFATSLGAAALGAFAPPLLVLVVIVCLGVAVFASSGDRGARARALVPAVLAPLLLGPWLGDVADDWVLAATGPGLSQWGSATTSPLALALLHPGGAGSTPWWVGALVVAAGLVGLLAPRRVRSVATGAALLGLVSLAGVLMAPRLELAPSWLGSGSMSATAVTAWSGTFILPLTLALLASAVVGAETLRGRLRTAATVGFVLAGLVTAGALGWFGFGEALRTWSDERPAVAVEQADNDLANRTLFVDPGATGAAYRIVGREASSLARSLPRDLEHETALADDVAGLLDGTQVSAGPRLAQRAIGFVAVAESAGEDVARRLDSAPGLSRLASRDGYAFWRVAALGASPERAVAPTRLSLVTGTDRAPVATVGEHGATETSVTAREGDLLVVAEPSAWTAHAEVSIDGRVLPPRADTEEPTYAVPAGTHDLVVEVRSEHPWWRLLQGLALVVVGFLAIPFGTRSFRSRR